MFGVDYRHEPQRFKAPVFTKPQEPAVSDVNISKLIAALSPDSDSEFERD